MGTHEQTKDGKVEKPTFHITHPTDDASAATAVEDVRKSAASVETYAELLGVPLMKGEEEDIAYAVSRLNDAIRDHGAISSEVAGEIEGTKTLFKNIVGALESRKAEKAASDARPEMKPARPEDTENAERLSATTEKINAAEADLAGLKERIDAAGGMLAQDRDELLSKIGEARNAIAAGDVSGASARAMKVEEELAALKDLIAEEAAIEKPQSNGSSESVKEGEIAEEIRISAPHFTIEGTFETLPRSVRHAIDTIDTELKNIPDGPKKEAVAAAADALQKRIEAIVIENQERGGFTGEELEEIASAVSEINDRAEALQNQTDTENIVAEKASGPKDEGGAGTSEEAVLTDKPVHQQPAPEHLRKLVEKFNTSEKGGREAGPGNKHRTEKKPTQPETEKKTPDAKKQAVGPEKIGAEARSAFMAEIEAARATLRELGEPVQDDETFHRVTEKADGAHLERIRDNILALITQANKKRASEKTEEIPIRADNEDKKRREDLRSNILHLRRKLPETDTQILSLERLEYITREPKITIEDLEKIRKNIKAKIERMNTNREEPRETEVRKTETAARRKGVMSLKRMENAEDQERMKDANYIPSIVDMDELEKKQRTPEWRAARKEAEEKQKEAQRQQAAEKSRQEEEAKTPEFYSSEDLQKHLEQSKTPEERIASAQNFEDLKKVIETFRDIPGGFVEFTGLGNQGRYGVKGLLWLMDKVREGTKSAYSVPDIHGLRDKVLALLENNPAAETKTPDRVADAQNLDELFAALKPIEKRWGETSAQGMFRDWPLPGARLGKRYGSVQLRELIDEVREGKENVWTIPEEYGVQKKVRELLKLQEKEPGELPTQTTGLSPAQEEEARVREIEKAAAVSAVRERAAKENALPSETERAAKLEEVKTEEVGEGANEVIPVADDMRTITDKLFAKRNLFGIPIRGDGARGETWTLLRGLKAYDVMQTDADAFLETIDAQKRTAADLEKDDIGALQTVLDTLFRESGNLEPNTKNNETIEEYMKRALRKKKSTA